MDEKQILMGLLSTAYKIDEKAAATLLYNEDGTMKPDALNLVLKQDTDRIGKLDETRTSYGKEQFGYGVRKAMEDLEKSIVDKFGVQSQKKGMELIEEIITLKSTPGDPKKITEDDVKKHPYVVSLEAGFKKSMDDLKTEHTRILSEKDESIKRDHTRGKIRDMYASFLQKNKAIMPENEERKKAVLSAFDNDIMQYDYQFPENEGDPVIVIKDGKRLDDKHGHAITIDNIFQTVSSRWFDFEAGEGRKDPKDPSKNKAPEVKYNFKKPENDRQYADEMAKIDEGNDEPAIKIAKKRQLTSLYRGTAN